MVIACINLAKYNPIKNIKNLNFSLLPVLSLDALNPTNWEWVKDLTVSVKSIAEVCNYLLHPSRILIALWNCCFDVSYLVCLLIALISLLLYIIGYKKFAKVIPLSAIVLVLVKAVGRI